MTKHRGLPGQTDTPSDYVPRHRADPPVIRGYDPSGNAVARSVGKHRADREVDLLAEHESVPCKHHRYMLVAKGLTVPECPNLSERGSLYCADHQTDHRVS